MSTQIGNIGEHKARFYFTRLGYEVYDGDSGATFDFIIYHPTTKEFKKVEVKTTQTRSKRNTGWVVRLKTSVHYAEDRPFDNTLSDLLFAYIEPEDRFVLFNSIDIKSKYQILIKDTKDAAKTTV